MLNESLVKYLAGLFDADGSASFTFRRQRDEHTEDLYYTGLTLRLASSEAVDLQGFVLSLPELTGMGSMSRYGAKKQFYTWCITKRSHIEMLIPRLVKHMLIKAKHFQWQLDVLRENSAKLITPAQCDELRHASRASRIERVGPLKPKNHTSWAWLAGYLDGDGSYKLKRYEHGGYERWHVSVSACAHENDAAVFDFLARTIGGIVRVRSREEEHLRMWHWNLGHSQSSYALRVLPYLAKHSRLKRHKIEQMIHHHRQQRLNVPTPAGEAIV
jgi:hypothetical protein